jgi:hypothetical protein
MARAQIDYVLVLGIPASLPTQNFHFVVAKNNITCKSNPGSNLPHPFNFPLYKFHSLQ